MLINQQDPQHLSRDGVSNCASLEGPRPHLPILQALIGMIDKSALHVDATSDHLRTINLLRVGGVDCFNDFGVAPETPALIRHRVLYGQNATAQRVETNKFRVDPILPSQNKLIARGQGLKALIVALQPAHDMKLPLLIKNSKGHFSTGNADNRHLLIATPRYLDAASTDDALLHANLLIGEKRPRLGEAREDAFVRPRKPCATPES